MLTQDKPTARSTAQGTTNWTYRKSPRHLRSAFVTGYADGTYQWRGPNNTTGTTTSLAQAEAEIKQHIEKCKAQAAAHRIKHPPVSIPALNDMLNF